MVEIGPQLFELSGEGMIQPDLQVAIAEFAQGCAQFANSCFGFLVTRGFLGLAALALIAAALLAMWLVEGRRGQAA